MTAALILMSTFQGDAYLSEQLDSILKQDFENWTLLIRDDGSTDKTLEIIHQYAMKDSRIQLMNDSLGNLKPAKSFSVLMGHALKRHEEFIFFADQDDVWSFDKLNLSIALLQNEKKPALVFSDLIVVDEKLKMIHPSFLQYEGLTAEKSAPLKTLLLHNYITGCTVGINRALLELAYPVPEKAIMHDWWCAMLASVCGKIHFISKKTVQYRQHHQNDIGSKGFYSKFKKIKKIKNLFYKRIEQAEKILDRIPTSNPHWEMINTFCNLPKHHLFSRIIQFYRLRLIPDGNLRKWGFFFLLF